MQKKGQKQTEEEGYSFHLNRKLFIPQQKNKRRCDTSRLFLGRLWVGVGLEDQAGEGEEGFLHDQKCRRSQQKQYPFVLSFGKDFSKEFFGALADLVATDATFRGAEGPLKYSHAVLPQLIFCHEMAKGVMRVEKTFAVDEAVLLAEEEAVTLEDYQAFAAPTTSIQRV